MSASLGDGAIPLELEQRLAAFDEALSDVEDILTNFQTVSYNDVCAEVITTLFAWKSNMVSRGLLVKGVISTDPGSVWFGSEP